MMMIMMMMMMRVSLSRGRGGIGALLLLGFTISPQGNHDGGCWFLVEKHQGSRVLQLKSPADRGDLCSRVSGMIVSSRDGIVRLSSVYDPGNRGSSALRAEGLPNDVGTCQGNRVLSSTASSTPGRTAERLPREGTMTLCVPCPGVSP